MTRKTVENASPPMLTPPRVGLFLPSIEMGGTANSVTILAKGLTELGYRCTLVATSCLPGTAFDRVSETMSEHSIPVIAPARGRRWMRDRFRITFEVACTFDLTINNHSEELRHLSPLLSGSVPQISIIRGVSPTNIRGAMCSSLHLEALVAISPVVYSKLVEEAQCNIELIPNSVTVPHGPLPALALPIRLAYVGRLSQEEKNSLILPDIVAELKRSGIVHELLIIGDGPTRSELELRFNAMGAGDSVRIVGALSPHSAANLMRTCQFVIVPSNHEGFGLVVAEAMACGALPIVSPLEVFTWILGDTATFLQTRTNTPDEYAKIILKLAAAPEVFLGLQQSNLARQNSLFSPDRMIEAYNRLITGILASRSRSGPLPKWQLPRQLPWRIRLRCSHAYRFLQCLRR